MTTRALATWHGPFQVSSTPYIRCLTLNLISDSNVRSHDTIRSMFFCFLVKVSSHVQIYLHDMTN